MQTKTMNNSKLPHRLALGLVFATLCLIFIGGLVTSTNSGLSVPDWPLSYGRFMPPMIGGIFYEHGHRMVATAVGFLTVILAFYFTFRINERWLKKAAWSAVGLVILQGVFGGMTVLLRLPKSVSILHGCTAQTFFSLTVALAVWTSIFWHQASIPASENKRSMPLYQIATTLFICSFIQLILGAVVRHTGWGLSLHISGAIIVLVMSVWISVRTWREKIQVAGLHRWALLHSIAAFLQISLGVATYLMKTHSFDVDPIPFYAIATITAHVMFGAFILGLSVVLALLAYKTRPVDGIPLQTKLSDYYELTKPGISFMAGFTAVAGFLLGSHGDVNLSLLIHTIFGTLLVAAAAGSLNMLIERDVDLKMARTKKRPLPAGRMNPGEALFVGCLLAVVGLVYLTVAVNGITALIAGMTLSIYLYVYTPMKKISSLCTAIGAVAGALPPLMGWTAATGRISIEGVVLFGILFFWQFPHFFSLAWLYKDDYAQAGLHMLPRVHDEGYFTAWSMVINSVALLIVSLLPTHFGLTGKFYFAVAFALGMWMIGTSVLFLLQKNRLRAKHIFLASILYIPILVIAMMASKVFFS